MKLKIINSDGNITSYRPPAERNGFFKSLKYFYSDTGYFIPKNKYSKYKENSFKEDYSSWFSNETINKVEKNINIEKQKKVKSEPLSTVKAYSDVTLTKAQLDTLEKHYNNFFTT